MHCTHSGETKPWSDSFKHFITSLELWSWDGPVLLLSRHCGIGLGEGVCRISRGLSLLRNAGSCLWLTCDKLRAAMLEGSKNKNKWWGEVSLLKGVEGIEGSGGERKEVRSEHKPGTLK